MPVLLKLNVFEVSHICARQVVMLVFIRILSGKNSGLFEWPRSEHEGKHDGRSRWSPVSEEHPLSLKRVKVATGH